MEALTDDVKKVYPLPHMHSLRGYNEKKKSFYFQKLFSKT